MSWIPRAHGIRCPSEPGRTTGARDFGPAVIRLDPALDVGGQGRGPRGKLADEAIVPYGMQLDLGFPPQ